MTRFLNRFANKLYRAVRFVIGQECPMRFAWLEDEVGTPIGEPIVFHHYLPPGKMHRAAQERVALEVRRGLPANAIRYVGPSDSLGGGVGMLSIIQPCRV